MSKRKDKTWKAGYIKPPAPKRETKRIRQQARKQAGK